MNTNITRLGSGAVGVLKSSSNSELVEYAARLCRMCKVTGSRVSTVSASGTPYSVLVIRVKKGLDQPFIRVFNVDAVGEPNMVIVTSGHGGNFLTVARAMHSETIRLFTPELLYTTLMALTELYATTSVLASAPEDLSESNFKFNSRG